MFEFPVYDYLFKIGIVLVILSFIVGFYGNDYEGISFSLHYYQYLYILVIIFAGIRYGILGGFLCATAFSALHIVALNFNEAYYRYQNLNVHYNFQIILFAMVGLITGYGYELMAQKLTNIEKTYKNTMKNRNGMLPHEKKDSKDDILSNIRSDVNVKNVNVLFKFTKNIMNFDSEDGIFEGFMSILALDYNAKEIVVFEKSGRSLNPVYSKNYSGEIPLSELNIGVGEKLPGKVVASSQFINLDPPDPDAEWMMGIPVITGKNCTHCIAISKWKSIKKINPEEIQNILRMATIIGNYIETINKIKNKAR